MQYIFGLCKTCSGRSVARLLLIIVICIAHKFNTAAGGATIAQNVCRQNCGSVRIPYPFGIGENCGLPSFQLHCDDERPYGGLSVQLSAEKSTQHRVLDISPTALVINATDLKATCCNCTADASLSIDSTAPYAASGENFFFVNGCKSAGSFKSDRTNGYVVKCETGCENPNPGSEDFCNSLGCCISPVPKGSRELHFTGGGTPDVDSPQICGFSSIIYPQSYIRSSSHSSAGPALGNGQYGVQLEWAIQGAVSCDDAASHPSYACSLTGSCTYVDSVPGYRCSCDKPGFIGDGYRNGTGCVDVNECQDPTLNGCHPNANCRNTLGGYTCECNQSLIGDGYANGTGCQPLLQTTIPLPSEEGLNLCGQNYTCSKNAACVNDGERFACKCPGNLIGDGLLNGTGCRDVIEKSYTAKEGAYVCKNNDHDPRCKSKSETAVALITVIAGSGVIILVLLGILGSWLMKRPNRHQPMNFYLRNLSKLKTLSEKFSATGRETAKIFTYKELSKASNGFASDLELGSGGYGTVFKGTLANGTVVAIKKTNHVSEDGTEQFLNEVNILSQVNHRNLVKLLGCCLETEVPILVYEYIPNGTLFDHLQRLRSGETKPLTCMQRLQIAIETAEALTYLHSAAFPPIYHRDVKSTNILLEEDLTVKVTDFGVSRLVPKNATHVSTCVMGTPGYMDPEYYHNYQLTDRSDVYSFGVVLLELITSLKPVDFERNSLQVNLAALSIPSIKAGELEKIVDPQFLHSAKPSVMEAIHSLAMLALACLATPRDDRPNMREVMEHLKRMRDTFVSLNPHPRELEDDSFIILDSISLSGSLDAFPLHNLEGR